MRQTITFIISSLWVALCSLGAYLFIEAAIGARFMSGEWRCGRPEATIILSVSFAFFAICALGFWLMSEIENKRE